MIDDRDRKRVRIIRPARQPCFERDPADDVVDVPFPSRRELQIPSRESLIFSARGYVFWLRRLKPGDCVFCTESRAAV